MVVFNENGKSKEDSKKIWKISSIKRVKNKGTKLNWF
jgi:hypothetical protein